MGSKDSMNFHSALRSAKDINVFNNEFTHAIIKYKFKKLKNIGLGQLVFYTLFMLVVLFGHYSEEDSVLREVDTAFLLIFSAFVVAMLFYNFVYSDLKLKDQDPW